MSTAIDDGIMDEVIAGMEDALDQVAAAEAESSASSAPVLEKARR